LLDPGTHAELSSVALVGQPLGAALQQVAGLAVRNVPGIRDASVTLIERNRPLTVAFHGPLAVALDERQYEAGFGPCVDAARGSRTIQVDTDDDAGTYADFARLARREGVRQVLALGLPAVEQTHAALNLYADQGPLDGAARAAAAVFVDYAALTLANAAVHARSLEQVAQMKEAMASRAVIEQAKGIIMVARHCSPDEAFEVLSKASSTAGRKVRDIAREIVERATSR
jgi:hypothetical protein